MKLLADAGLPRHVHPAFHARVHRAAEGSGARFLKVDLRDYFWDDAKLDANPALRYDMFAVMPARGVYAGPQTAAAVHFHVTKESEEDCWHQFLTDGEEAFLQLVCDVADYFAQELWLLEDAVAIPGGFVAWRRALGRSDPHVEIVLRSTGATAWTRMSVSTLELQETWAGTPWGNRLLAKAPHYLAAFPALTGSPNPCMNAMSYALHPAPLALFMSEADESTFFALAAQNTRPDLWTFDREYGIPMIARMAHCSFSQATFDLVGDGRANPLVRYLTCDFAADVAMRERNVPALRAFARASALRGDLDWWLARVKSDDEEYRLEPELRDLLRSEITRAQASKIAREIASLSEEFTSQNSVNLVG